MELPTKRPDYSQYKVDKETGELIKVHDEAGAEIPDPVPMAPPLGYTQPLSMFDQMRSQIRAEHNRLRQLELESLEETVEEANDFDVEEDFEDQPSLYEEKFDPVDFEVRNRLRQAEFRAQYEDRVDKLPDQQKELLNGDSLRVHERRSEGSQRRSGQSNQKRESDPGEVEQSDDGGGERQMDSRTPTDESKVKRGVAGSKPQR